jgi:hypothetical protein
MIKNQDGWVSTMTSRRVFLRGLASVATAETASILQGQRSSREAASKSLRFLPLMEFRGAAFGGISADSRKACAVLSDGVDVFAFREGQWSHQGAGTILRDASLWVFELGSWKTVFSAKLSGMPFITSFFRDSDELYVVTLPYPGGKGGNRQVVIDLPAGKIVQDEERDGLFKTTRGQRLLTRTEDLGRGVAISVVELPDYHEVARVAVEAPVSGRVGGDQIVSSQGDAFVYGVDDLVVCRRTDDLSVVWTRRIAATRVWRTAISARGDRVAAVADAAPQRSPRVPPELRPLYIEVYEGRSGVPVARFPADTFFDSLALSADGKLLAVGRRAPTGDFRNMDLLADIHDVGSGRHIAQLLHCRVPPESHQTLAGIEFSADGRYAVTAGWDRTKVWEITA